MEGLQERNDALLERVAQLEVALEKIAEGRWNVGASRDIDVRQYAREVLEGRAS
jgi:hypothetical protein